MTNGIAKLIYKPELKVENKVHAEDQFLDLSLEQLLAEPVVLLVGEFEGQESDPDSIPQDLVVNEDEFLDLEFEALFDIPVRVARVDVDGAEDTNFLGDISSQASSFTNLLTLNENQEKDYNDDLPP